MKKVNITMKKSFFVMATIATNFIFGQVGINNSDPKATLDVTAKTTNGTKPEGIIAPRLAGSEIQSGDAQYTTAQTGTIVYATSASPGAAMTGEKTININGPGYYYFDGLIWQKFNSGTVAPAGTEPWYDVATNTGATANTQDIYQMGKVGIGTNAPNASAVLDIVSTKGVLLPRMATNPAAPATGLLIYRTDKLGFYAWNGTAWTQTVFGGGLEPWFVQGTTNTQATGNTQNIYQMGNVGIGVNSPSPTTKLHVEAPTPGTGFRLVDGSQGAGKILTSDASGKASWVSTTPPIAIDSTPGVLTNLDVTNPDGANMTFTGASAVVTIPGQYLISTRFIADKLPAGCSSILAFNLNKDSSTVFDRPTSTFPYQDAHMPPGNGAYDFIYTTQTAYLTAGTYYMFVRTQGGGVACTNYTTRSSFAENSFTLTLLK